LLKHTDKAAQRLLQAIQNKEKITIFGDYDVDGTTSCAMLFLFFEEIGYLEEQGLMTEQVWDFLGKIFGNSVGGVAQTIVEPLVNSLL
jgi:TRAP-type mannitol/chloroaromatic compound transport system permease large subunit